MQNANFGGEKNVYFWENSGAELKC